jgi:hypothetical protein
MDFLIVLATCIFGGIMAAKFIAWLFRPKKTYKVVAAYEVKPDGTTGECIWKACPPHTWGEKDGRIFCSNCKKFASEM